MTGHLMRAGEASILLVRWFRLFVLGMLLLALAWLNSQSGPAQAQSGEMTVAMIGDFGDSGPAEASVAALVASWSPEFILTAGDNNYPIGAASTVDENVGQYYHDWIKPYSGIYGPESPDINRFYPSIGNHDFESISCSGSNCTGPHFDFFDLPGNERYYDIVQGPYHFFIISSDPREPDGRSSTSTQAQWLESALAGSSSPWKLVFMHHAPYSSSAVHGSQSILQWPYKDWGATAIFAGHDHTYERLLIDDLLYFVNGLGGRGFYSFGSPIAGSQVRFNSDYGAMRLRADSNTITFEFMTQAGLLIDSVTLDDTGNIATATPTPTPSPTPLSAAGDVNCDGVVNVVDAMIVLQYDAGLRSPSSACTVNADEIYLPSCDVMVNGICDSVDALLILQCDAGISNILCP